MTPATRLLPAQHNCYSPGSPSFISTPCTDGVAYHQKVISDRAPRFTAHLDARWHTQIGVKQKPSSMRSTSDRGCRNGRINGSSQYIRLIANVNKETGAVDSSVPTGPSVLRWNAVQS